uniref:Histidine N-acetyltransferase C-terminal domain-containing protein n=1 Tax=Leptobrachium leishanense TaxID=445787 RepID=A0A8C5PUC2_9ANUR
MENPPANMMISHRIIHCKAVVSVFLSAKELEEAFRILESRIPIACKESLPPVFMDYSEVHGLFSGSLKEEDLVPERFLIQSWLPITTCKANLDLLQRGGVKWLCSYPCDAMRRVNESSGSSGVTGKSDIISVSGTGPSTSTFKGFVSLGTPVFLKSVDNGKHCLDIDMYGTDLSCASMFCCK